MKGRDQEEDDNGKTWRRTMKRGHQEEDNVLTIVNTKSTC